MIGHRVAVDQNIIKKYDHKFADERLENAVYICLKGRQSICEPKRHNEKLKMSVVGAEISPMNIVHMHADLMVS